MPHHVRSSLVMRVCGVDQVAGRDPDGTLLVAVIERYGMDRIVSRYAELYITLAGGAA
jgi:hypothetical protein